MGALTNYISVSITRDTLRASRRTFDVPMYLSYYAATAERLRYYSSLAEVEVDHPVTTSPEWLFAAAAFSDDPHLARVAIGRGANKPTKVYTFTPVVQNSHVYRFVVGGKGVTTTSISVTSDASATATEICDLVRTAMNTIVDKNFTATGTTTLIVTGNAAGDWFWIEQVDIDDWTGGETHADPGVAADLSAIALEQPGWYFLVTGHNSNAYVLAAATWIEANSRQYLVDTAEATTLTTAVGNSETADDIHTAAYDRTSAWWHRIPGEAATSALLGQCLAYQPGQVVFGLKRLSSITPNDLTTTHRNNLTARNANSYEPVGDTGFSLTFDGKVGSGEYIDVIRDLDWLVDEMSKALLDTISGVPKLPMTNPGLRTIRSKGLAVLALAVDRGVLAADPAPEFLVPLVSEIPEADRAARRVTGIQFTGTLANAAQYAAVRGSISL